jgi:formylglycine-generating enzyme required for sulfatase activity
MPRIFISYSRKDEEFARRLMTSFAETGADVWIDLEDIPAGMKWSSAIQEGLDGADLMVVIISPDSMISRNVEDEWQYYLDHSKPIIPILLKPAKIHFQLSRIQYIDFSNQSYYTALNQLYSEFRRKGISFVGAPNVVDRPPISHTPPEQQTLIRASAPKPPPMSASPTATRQSDTGRRTLLLVGAAVAVVAVILIIGLVLLRGNPSGDNTPTDVPLTNTSQVVVEAPTNTDLPPTLPPTETIMPTETLLPTQTLISLGFPGNPVTSNAQWQFFSQTFDGTEMMLVPAGCFTMGSGDADINAGLQQCPTGVGADACHNLVQDEVPQAQICFDQPYWIDRTEVTNAAYESSGTYSGDNLPRTNVTWQDAQAYCQRRGGRLPTEAEWEYAARGPDNLTFPWGNTFNGNVLNYCDGSCEFNWHDANFNDGQPQSADAGSYLQGASWVGALNMGGNVWEWTSSLYWNYPYNAGDGRENSGDLTTPRTLRGGSWNWIGLDARTTARDDPIQESADWYGFRCVRDY